MAEVAIPIAVLGVMYIISNKKDNKTVEGFSGQQQLPNVQKIPINYPKDTKKELLNDTNVQTYQGYKNSSENGFTPFSTYFCNFSWDVIKLAFIMAMILFSIC